MVPRKLSRGSFGKARKHALLHLRAHPDLKVSYQLLNRLENAECADRASSLGLLKGPIEHLYYPLLAKRLGLLRSARFALTEDGEEPRFLSRKRLKWLALGGRSAAEIPDARPASAIISSLGRESIFQALQSLCSQNLGFKEILVGWDGLSAQAAARLERKCAGFGIRGVRFFRFSRNSGPGWCRNRLSREARSETLIFFDDDDLALPSMHRELLRSLRAFDADLVTPARVSFGGSDFSELIVHFGAEPFGAFFNFAYIGDSCMIVRKSAFEEAGGFSERRELAEDTPMLVRMALAGRRLLPYPHPLFLYRKARGSRSQGLDLEAMERAIGAIYESRIGGITKAELECFRNVATHWWGLGRAMSQPEAKVSIPLEMLSPFRKR